MSHPQLEPVGRTHPAGIEPPSDSTDSSTLSETPSVAQNNRDRLAALTAPQRMMTKPRMSPSTLCFFEKLLDMRSRVLLNRAQLNELL